MGDDRGSSRASRRFGLPKKGTGRPFADLAYWLSRLAPIAVILLLWVGVWTLGGGVVSDNGWFCGTTNKSGTTVTLPSEPMLVDELDQFLKDQNGCATLAIELTVTGESTPNTVIEPIGQSVTFNASEPIPVRVEATAMDFWLECGDFTGQRAGHFPTFRSGDRKACDPVIETRCQLGDGLQLCAEIGNSAQRCLTADGHVVATCAGDTETCLDQNGHFVGCKELLSTDS